MPASGARYVRVIFLSLVTARQQLRPSIQQLQATAHSKQRPRTTAVVPRRGAKRVVDETSTAASARAASIDETTALQPVAGLDGVTLTRGRNKAGGGGAQSSTSGVPVSQCKPANQLTKRWRGVGQPH